MKDGIRRVEPFNDIYTHDCFLNSLLCAARHYQLDFPLLTLHKIYFYSLEGGQLEGGSMIMYTIEELSLAIGLKVHKEKDNIQNWKKQYALTFEREDIIIALLDDYYNPLRVDIYKKEHLPHYVLLYNIDMKNETLSVIESRYRETVSNKKLNLNFIDYEQAHFENNKSHMYILSKGNCNINNSFKDKYLQMQIILTKKSIINLHLYIDYLSLNKVKEKESWLNNINQICNQVKVEQYIYEKIYCNKQLSFITTEIFENWYLIRTFVVKLSMVQQADRLESKIIVGHKEIEKLEKHKLSILCSDSIET